MKKAAFVAVVLLALGVIAKAQQPKKIPRIGFLGASSVPIAGTRIEAFRQGLRGLGYVTLRMEAVYRSIERSAIES